MTAEGTGIVEVTLPGLPGSLVEVEIVEPTEEVVPTAPLSFDFERPSYRVAAGKHKRIRLLAPSHTVRQHGSNVIVTSSNSHGILVRHTHLELAPAQDGDWHEASIDVEGRQHGAQSVLTAISGDAALRAITTVTVSRDQTGPTPPQIKLAAMGSPVRGTFETDEAGAVTITVNATHPAVRRYFGPKPEFAGQDSPHARLMVAEVVADLTVLDVLRRHLRQKELPVEQIYRRRFLMLNDLLPLCHASQLSEDDFEAIAPSRRAGKKRLQTPSALDGTGS